MNPSIRRSRRSTRRLAERIRCTNPIVYLRIVLLGKGAARLTLSQFVDKIAASFDGISVVPCDEFFGGARMWQNSSIADSWPGQLSSSAPES